MRWLCRYFGKNAPYVMERSLAFDELPGVVVVTPSLIPDATERQQRYSLIV